VEREIINDSIDEAVADSTAKEFLAALKAIQEKVAINLIHDLRTPITVAKLSADIIKMNPDRTDLCLRNSKRIVRSMEKMEKMVSNLMNLTEIGL
jgi:K+-sensing histidine kinase KdpD